MNKHNLLLIKIFNLFKIKYSFLLKFRNFLKSLLKFLSVRNILKIFNKIKRRNMLSEVKVGHYTDEDAITGCTVILLPEEGAVCGVDVRGGAPGTRETDLLDPTCMVERVNAICISGGSAFGLAAADGVIKYLEEKNIGFETPYGKVPIVPTAILFDLNIGNNKIRPGKEEGYTACQNASSLGFEVGSVGAGAGATVGKVFGNSFMMKSGLGRAILNLSGGIEIFALAVVNSFGDVINKDSSILAGAYHPKEGFLNSKSLILEGVEIKTEFGESTTIVVIITNVLLDKASATKVAQMAHDGLSRAISPVHTEYDGDITFVLSIGKKKAPTVIVGTATAEATAKAIRNAVIEAKSLGGVRDINQISIK
jgi:L-aminopeptidase/D-esterase-like protein